MPSETLTQLHSFSIQFLGSVILSQVSMITCGQRRKLIIQRQSHVKEEWQPEGALQRMVVSGYHLTKPSVTQEVITFSFLSHT